MNLLGIDIYTKGKHMAAARTYTAQEIRELVELMRGQSEISQEKFSGMEFIASVCERFQHSTDRDIEKMVSYYFGKV